MGSSASQESFIVRPASFVYLGWHHWQDLGSFLIIPHTLHAYQMPLIPVFQPSSHGRDSTSSWSVYSPERFDFIIPFQVAKQQAVTA